MMRRYHRWVSFPLIIFLIAVIVTGLYLQAVEIQHAADGGPERPLERTAPERAEILAAVDSALETAKAERPDFPLQKIEISYKGGSWEAKALTNKRRGPSVTIDGKSGNVTYVEKPPRTVRTIFILLHSGKYYGMTGLIVIMLASIILLFLSVSGIWVYYDMWRRRRKAKKKGFFWK